MTEPYMAPTDELPQNRPQVAAKPRRDGWRSTLQRLIFVFVLAGSCGLMLTGCQEFWDSAADLLRIDGGDAEAQNLTEVRVKTYTINVDGFEIVLDNESDPTPTPQIVDSATELTMQSEGTLVPGNGNANIELEVADVIILRLNGNTGSATLIRAD
ncbi:hypothetical protein [Candidatus Entotheonella palauensis]